MARLRRFRFRRVSLSRDVAIGFAIALVSTIVLVWFVEFLRQVT